MLYENTSSYVRTGRAEVGLMCLRFFVIITDCILTVIHILALDVGDYSNCCCLVSTHIICCLLSGCKGNSLFVILSILFFFFYKWAIENKMWTRYSLGIIINSPWNQNEQKKFLRNIAVFIVNDLCMHSIINLDQNNFPPPFSRQGFSQKLWTNIFVCWYKDICSLITFSKR